LDITVAMIDCRLGYTATLERLLRSGYWCPLCSDPLYSANRLRV